MIIDPVALIVAGIALATAISGVWVKLNANRRALDEYRIHVAERYVTKAGMHEQTAQIMAAIVDVRSEIRNVDVSVEQLNQRIDRVIEAQRPKPA